MSRDRIGAVDEIVVELTATRTGDYVVSYSGDLPSLPPRVVLDEGYRYPNHPQPGMSKPPAAVNDGRPTDPAVLAEVQGLVAEFVERSTQLLGEPPRFTSGYGYREAEILAVEERLGVRLPEDLRALYRTIHDDNTESGLLGRFSPASLEQVVAWYHDGDPGSYLLDEGLFAYDPVVFETHPYGHVRRLSRSDWWVTFAPDYGMNYAAVDLDPAELGAYGQVLTFGRDVHGPIVYVAASVRHRMRTVRRPCAAQRPVTRGGTRANGAPQATNGWSTSATPPSSTWWQPLPTRQWSSWRTLARSNGSAWRTWPAFRTFDRSGSSTCGRRPSMWTCRSRRACRSSTCTSWPSGSIRTGSPRHRPSRT
jgi:SMI1 / KNR4 family (SUKH-1)